MTESAFYVKLVIQYIFLQTTNSFLVSPPPCTMPFCEELAAANGSSFVKDMMVVRFGREVSMAMVDEAELLKKVQDIRPRVAEREYVIGELEALYLFDCSVQSISHIKQLQAEDLREATDLLDNMTKKQKRAQELASFTEKLKGVVY